MKILLLGPPASGKGTVGEDLSDLLKVPLISAGRELRNLPETHPRYKEVHECMNAGKPAPKDFLGELLDERTSREDCKNGFVMDGWGRAMVDLEHFDPDFDLVLLINLSREAAIKRITGRRICDADGEIYNIYTLPKDELEKCKGNFTQREDDNEGVVNYRYDLFESETSEVVDHFKKMGILVEVDGEPLPEQVLSGVLSALKVSHD